MRVEILLELEPGDDLLELPWVSPAASTLRYVDLKKLPEEIHQLAECRRFPPLATLLHKINAPGSAFRSAKCDAWTTTKLTEEEFLDFKLPFKIGSYVDIVFDRPEFSSDLDHHIRVGEEIAQLLLQCRIQAQLEIAIRHCLFHPKERWGYYFTAFVHAYAATSAEAKEEWSRAIGALGDALAAIDQVLRKSHSTRAAAASAP